MAITLAGVLAAEATDWARARNSDRLLVRWFPFLNNANSAGVWRGAVGALLAFVGRGSGDQPEKSIHYLVDAAFTG